MATLSPTVWAAITAAGLEWLPTELLSAFSDGWLAEGTPAAALATMRSHPSYEATFPGNTRVDGTARFMEGTYLNLVDDYEQTVREAGVDPDLFTAQQFGELVAGDVSAQEFQSRVNSISVGIRQRSDEVRSFYTGQFGIDLTDADLIASVMDPALGDAILSERIAIGQIGGAAAERGFTISGMLASRLEDMGLGYSQAEELFRAAGLQLPTLDRLARRHRDPNDPFDLDEYLGSAAFGSPEAARAVRRLQMAEMSEFRSPRSSLMDRQSGSLTGLVEQ